MGRRWDREFLRQFGRRIGWVEGERLDQLAFLLGVERRWGGAVYAGAVFAYSIPPESDDSLRHRVAERLAAVRLRIGMIEEEPR